jgi:hypothetical protein
MDVAWYGPTLDQDMGRVFMMELELYQSRKFEEQMNKKSRTQFQCVVDVVVFYIKK